MSASQDPAPAGRPAPAGADPARPGGDRPLAGILWMVATGLCFVAVTAIVKHVGREVPAQQAVFVRYALGLLFFLPVIRPMLASLGDGPLMRVFALRGVAQTIGSLFWFHAMTQIPMQEVTAMNYLQPVYITIGAVLFLGERIALPRILAIVVAIIGAMIILRPGLRDLSGGHLAMLISAPGFAASYLLAKRASGQSSALVVVGWLSVFTTLFLAPFALAAWQPLAPAAAGWLFVTAGVATLAHYTMTRAFAAAPITLVQPVTFMQLVWSASLGALLFGEPVDHWVMLGGTVIVGAVVFISWREARHRRIIAGRAV